MDLLQMIAGLEEEQRQIDIALVSLRKLAKSRGNLSSDAQALVGGARPAGKRGRKFMKGPERLRVGERMKEYWEKRRQHVANQHPGSPKGLKACPLCYPPPKD